MSVSAVSFHSHAIPHKTQWPSQTRSVMRPKMKAPQHIVTAPPFTRAAEAQAAAIRTGRIPHRGAVIDIKV